MTFEQIYYFLEVYRQKSFSKAANNLMVSRQSLSFSIKRLEDELQSCFFIRKQNGIETTKEGELFFEYAKNFFQANVQIKQKLLECQNNSQKNITYKVGLSTYVMSTYGEFLYNSLKKVFPNFFFDFGVLNQSDIHDFDFIITLSGDATILKIKQKINDPNDSFLIKIINTYICYIWCSKRSPLAKEKTLSFDMLYDYSFCTLKETLDFSRGYLFFKNKELAPKTLSIKLEGVFIDYVEKLGYIAADVPFANNAFAFSKIFANRDVVIRPTDLKLSLITIYKKSIGDDIYNVVANLANNNKKS